MVYDGVLEGRFVNLSSVTEDDAFFTRMVRQDPRLTKYLPNIDNTIAQQQEWIRNQRNKEGDYFFLAKDKNGRPVGTIGIYNIRDGFGEGGRLTSIGNALQSLEIQYLILLFDFEILKLDYVTTVVYAENKSAMKLSKIFGIVFDKPISNNDGRTVCYGRITKEEFKKSKLGIEKMLYRRC